MLLRVSSPERRSAIEGISHTQLSATLHRTERLMRAEGLRGYDPYDGLSSPPSGLPVLCSQRLLRFGAQQFLKRLPVNLRPLLRMDKQLNPVTVASSPPT